MSSTELERVEAFLSKYDPASRGDFIVSEGGLGSARHLKHSDLAAVAQELNTLRAEAARLREIEATHRKVAERIATCIRKNKLALDPNPKNLAKRLGNTFLNLHNTITSGGKL